MTKTIQKQRVLDYIREAGSITPLEALKELGVMRLSDVVFKLKKDGYLIKTELVPVQTRYGIAHVAKYSEVAQDDPRI